MGLAFHAVTKTARLINGLLNDKNETISNKLFNFMKSAKKNFLKIFGRFSKLTENFQENNDTNFSKIFFESLLIPQFVRKFSYDFAERYVFSFVQQLKIENRIALSCPTINQSIRFREGRAASDAI